MIRDPVEEEFEGRAKRHLSDDSAPQCNLRTNWEKDFFKSWIWPLRATRRFAKVSPRGRRSTLLSDSKMFFRKPSGSR